MAMAIAFHYIPSVLNRVVQCVSCGQDEASILQGSETVMGFTAKDLSEVSVT